MKQKLYLTNTNKLYKNINTSAQLVNAYGPLLIRYKNMCYHNQFIRYYNINAILTY